jgi:twitching motility protein PilT
MDTKELLAGLAGQIPVGLAGIERQRRVGALVDQLESEDLALLRRTVEGFLGRMATKNASDMDLGGAGCRGLVWYRVFGEKCPDTSTEPMSEDEYDLLCHSLITERQRQFLYENRNLDFSYAIGTNGGRLRYRADLYFELDHLALNMRYIPNEIRPFKTLGLHPNAVKAITLAYDKQGLTLVTGITGSGKSSTLDSIVDANNQTANAHIVVIGSPIETVHEPKKSIVRHREVGSDVPSFKEGAVQALRQDPDVIVIGEMRDPETIFTALEIADSGHKVFSTLHTASAVESIDRIIGECPPAEQNRVRERLGDVLKCVISQKLVPSLDGKRVMAKEVLLMTPSARAATKNGNTGEIYQMMHEGQESGMNILEQDLARLVGEGVISDTEALNHANNKRRMEELL